MNESTAVVPVDARPDSSAVVLWGTDDPRGMTARMTNVADAMAAAVRERGMANQIDGREYVRAEGWALVGAMVGIFPRTAALDEIREDGVLVGFRATTELVARDGAVVGGAVALCTVSEAKWAGRDWNQIASMAQTRANAKAYRQTLGFIMPMAGYAATPAEEMDGIFPDRDRSAPATTATAGDWWTRLITLGKQHNVTVSQMATIAVAQQDETPKAAITRWLNDNTSAADGDTGLMTLIDLASAVPTGSR